MLDLWFDRAIAPARNATKGQRLANHEIIFDGSRTLRVRTNELFPIDKSAVGNNSLKDDAESTETHSHSPFEPFHCDICGKLCRVTLENPWEHSSESPPVN